MSARRASLAEALDDAGEVVRAVAVPWLGLAWLTALPLRFVQANTIARLIDLGAESGHYAAQLASLAAWITATFIVALWGRAVFVRAVSLRLRANRAPGAEALRVSAASLACYTYVALAIEVGGLATLAAIVSLPLAILLSGLAAATTPLSEKPSLFAPWREIVRALARADVLVGLLLVFGLAWLLVTANLYVAFRIGVWLAHGVPGLDLVRWSAILDLSNPRFVLVLFVGGALVVEPFWLAALTIHVHKVRARASGDDLRLWFDRLRSEAA
jgi:hypothetical protein